jgi:hypothetical protein
MSHPYFPAALARERQNTLLAEAEARRRARQARAQRHRQATPATHRPLLCRLPAWLAPAWRRLLTRRPESASETTG